MVSFARAEEVLLRELLGIDQSDHIPQHCTFHSPLCSPFDFIVKNGLNGEADKSDLHIFDFSVLT